MSMTPQVNVLEYSIPGPDSGRWGPIFFKPSLLTFMLVLVTTAATTWLALRHEPWRRVSTFPIANGAISLSSSGNLLSFSHDWADLYDGVTGRTINSILLNANFSGDHMVQSGDQFLVVPGNSTVATLMDLRSGSLQHLQVPVNPKDVKGIAVNPPRVLAAGADRRFASFYELHQLLPTAATQPTRLQAEAWWIDFSPDGRRILTLDPRTDLPARAAMLTLVDGISGQIIAEPIITGEVSHPGNYFASPNWLVIPTSGGGGNSVNFDVYSATTGRRTHSVQIPGTGPRMMPVGPFAISDDGRLIARVTFTGPTVTLQIFDTSTGAQVISRPTRVSPTFFPQSHRLLTDLITPTSRHLVVTDPAQEQPLAVLSDSPSSGKSAIRPDGQMIALMLAGNSPQAAIYRKMGWDCPESPVGAFAFPHLWLLTACCTALALSLFRDARRERTSSKAIPYSMLAISLPLTLHALLTACLGRWTLTPAPVLLITAIGLATQSRIWRWTTLIVLAANLPLCLYLARRIQQQGLNTSSRYELFDRSHDIPNIIPFTALAAAAVLIIIALPLLARPSAQRLQARE